MERLDCSAVYIDDRVRTERWVYRSPVEGQSQSQGQGASPGARRSSTLSDEPDSLQSDVDMLLGVCRQGMYPRIRAEAEEWSLTASV